MFPNPHSALPLPPRSNLERYRKLAKELTAACRSGNPKAVGDWAEQWVGSLMALKPSENSGQSRERINSWIREVEDFARRKLLESADGCSLTGAQFVIARSHGFESWPKFATHLEALARGSSTVSRFEAAADAIVAGEVGTLKRLLSEDAALVRASSTREHGATLLHYVSANGVEDFRQKTPRNIVEVAEILLQAGARVDATANVYGGRCTTLGLAATSGHPKRAGVQEALLQKLLDHGAKMEELSISGNSLSIVIGCVANGCPQAAAFLASRGAPLNLAGAAALGRLDAVKTFFEENGSLRPDAAKDQLAEGFLYSASYGHTSVVAYLLGKGADPLTQNREGQTALHLAAIGGHLGTVELLLRHNPPLEARNRYGGTVLGQTLWSAAHGGDPDVYIAILEFLAAAGAAVPERHVPVNARVDAWLARHGSRPEPGWNWYGEGPRREK